MRPRSTPRGPRDLVGDPTARVERVGRVLEDDLDPAAGFARARLRPAARSGAPSNVIRPAEGACRPATQRAIVVLPEPDSPTSARHSPAASGEGDVVRRDDRLVAAAVDRAEPLDRESSAAGQPAASRTASGGCSVERRASSATRSSGPRAAPRPSSSGGTSSSQRSTRCGQRGANAQPAGRSPTPTATPGIPRTRRGATWSGIERDEPARVRVPRAREELGRRAALDDAARRT